MESHESQLPALLSSDMEPEILSRLMHKISEQALELGKLNNELQQSSDYVKRCESRIRSLESSEFTSSGCVSNNLSELAMKRRDERELLRKLDEYQQNNNKLEQDLRDKIRQCKNYEKQIAEMGMEVSALKHQLSSATQSLNVASKINFSSANTYQTKLLASLKAELESVKACMKSYQSQLEKSKYNEIVLNTQLNLLHETLAAQTKDTNDGKEENVLALCLSMQKQLSECKLKLANVSVLQDNNQTFDTAKNKGFTTVSTNTESKFTNILNNQNDYFENLNEIVSSDGVLLIERLKVEVMSLQQKLSRNDDELKRLLLTDQVKAIKAAERERDILLEFIQVFIEYNNLLKCNKVYIFI